MNMSNNEMNYPVYNTITYSRMIQQEQTFYEQRFPNSFLQSSIISPYSAYQMYSSSSISNPSQYNNYDHIIQSTAKTLPIVTHPTEISLINNSHHSIKNFSNALNSTRMYYCEICRIACGGYATYQAHLNGSKHKKKELMTSTNSKLNINILRCELCDITCTSSDAYQAHLDGSKHKKAMKLYRKLGKTIPSTSSSQISINDNQQNSLLNLISNDRIQPIGEEYIETTYDNTNKPILYHCKLCQCKLNDIKGKDIHLKGKRHRLSYKKKINSKQKQINIQQSNNNQIKIDDDIKYLMMLHEEIIPTTNFLNMIEEFVSAVESALKSCSEYLQTSSDTTIKSSSLMGVSRIGLLGKNLIIKTDHLFELVLICKEWPTKKLFQTIQKILLENFDDIWKTKIQIQCIDEKEIIEIQTNINEEIRKILIRFTSPTIEQQENDETNGYLSKMNRLNALNAIYSTRWFQNQIHIHQHTSTFIRCLRYKTQISTNWKSLSSEAIEILINYISSQFLSSIQIFRKILEYFSSGLVLSNDSGLSIPWQTDRIKDIFENLTQQERHDITQEAQLGLRLMSFGQLNKWYE